MKTILSTVILLLSFNNANANLAFQVEGTLSSDQRTLTTDEVTLKVSENVSKQAACEEGIFTVVRNNWGASEDVTLLSVDQCFDGPTFCYEIYRPECGMKNGKAKVYTNDCELEKDKATPVDKSLCEGLEF
ncbi:putative exported protein [Halobacteriovorax marinus SJ]|uniref:Exported protein n=1 Tax=Halobacteriovorax marinus (strain ATCC BAA-682 / DSM 15412 / SJ) TaxID=862908 RepID=E1X3B2_HALMS|nr:hypothetical protein [Halobacteriovorax marinus]CBW25207.1 putative exported protein [Halobacteriovorax marinus SJ]